MPHVTDQAPPQHHPVLPEPSYASTVINRIADLIEYARPDSLISALGLRRLFTVAIAELVAAENLPDAAADDLTKRVDHLLPPLAPDTTCSEYAALLRETAVSA